MKRGHAGANWGIHGRPKFRRAFFESLEDRRLLTATLVLPQTDVPSIAATIDINTPGGPFDPGPGYPVAGGNFAGTLNDTALISYCVGINLTIDVSATYNNATVTSNGTIYGSSVPQAAGISWLLTNIGPTAVTLIQQDALQAAIWRTEYGSGFQLDGVDNDNPAAAFNSTVGTVYKADFAALGSKNRRPVGNVVWISPGTNSDTTQAQGLVALSGCRCPADRRTSPRLPSTQAIPRMFLWSVSMRALWIRMATCQALEVCGPSIARMAATLGQSILDRRRNQLARAFE